MQVIGITGGIGAGKSQVLQYIKQHYDCRIILADDVGNEVKLPGKNCYKQLVELLGNDILDVNGFIVKEKMAAKIFSDVSLLSKVNAVIHPAVQEYILTEIKKERLKQQYDFFFIEAALLIECGYSAIVDEMWYIYADEETRTERLMKNRGYSEYRDAAQ